MGFMSALESELNKEISITENGAIGYKTSGDKLVDFNFAVGSMRNWAPAVIYNDFVKFYTDDKITAMRYLFYLRDREEGLGERRTFRAILSGLAKDYPEDLIKVIDIVPFFGRWDDLWCLLDTEVGESVYELVAKQLIKDKVSMEAKMPISLLAKWMPSINTSSSETKILARKFKNHFGLTEKKYRKMLSSMREYLNVLETKVSAGEWSEVDYNAVPAKANLLYNSAFLKHDEERRRNYLAALVRNDGTAKINAGVLFPYDIVHNYGGNCWSMKSYDETLEQLWKNLPDFVKGESNTLVIRDGSGSMDSCISSNSRVTALDVATALTIYFSERSEGEFKDKFITFSRQPKYINLSKCNSLHDKLRKCYAENDCSNTNLEATFDLILNTAIDNHLSQEELPKNVLIVSDMEFDGATTSYYYHGYNRGGNKTLMEIIARKFKAAGYKMPKLIFWNVNSRTNTIPLQKNEAGVILVGGFSAAIAKMVLSEELDPLKALLATINVERYDCVSARLSA